MKGTAWKSKYSIKPGAVGSLFIKTPRPEVGILSVAGAGEGLPDRF